MTDYVLDKAIENVGDDAASNTVSLPTLNVPLFEPTDKDPYDAVPLPVNESRQDKVIRQMYADAKAYEERNPTGTSTIGDKAAGAVDETVDYLGSLAKDAGESMKQVFVGGALDASQSLLNTALDVGEWTFEKLGLPATNERYTFAESIVPPSDAPFLQFQRNMVDYMSNFAGASQLTKGLQAATITKNMVNGMIADFITTDPREEKIKDLLKKTPNLSLPFMTAMHSDESIGTDMWQKVETMYKGALIGLGFEAGSVALQQSVKTMMSLTKNYKLARMTKQVSEKELTATLVKDAGADSAVVIDKTPDMPPPVERIQSEEAEKLLELIKAGKARDRAFNLTLAGITNQKQVQRVINALVDNSLEMFAKQKGGIKPREVLQKEAEALGLTVDKLLRRQAGTPTWDAMNRASADVMENVFEDLAKAAEMYEKGLLAADDFMKAGQVADAIALQVSDMATMSGRAEQAWQAVGVAKPSGAARAKQVQEIEYIYGNNLKERAAAYKKLVKMEKKAQQMALEYAKAQGRLMPSVDDCILAINNWRLSNPVTHAKNIISNTTQSALAVSDSFFQEIVSTLTGRKSTVAGETAQLIKGMFAGFGDAMATASHNIRNPKDAVPIFNDADAYTKLGQMNLAENMTTVGKAAGAIKFAVRGDVVGKALGAADDVFKSINYRGELRREAHRIATLRGLGGETYEMFMRDTLSAPPPEMHLKALNAAREHTFTQDRVGLGLKIEQLVRDPAWMKADRLLLPFIGTNMNVLEQTLMRTPVIGLLTTRARQAIAESATNPRALDKLIGKQATGAALLGTVAYYMGEYDLYQPAVVGDKDREKLAKSFGIVGSTLKVGNEFINMDAFSPMTGVVKFLANMKELYDIASDSNKLKLDDGMAMAAYAVGELMNPAFVTDAGGAFVNALVKGDVEEMRYVFTGLGSSVVPYNGLIRQVTKDGTKVDTRVAGGLDAWMSEFTNNMRAVIAPKGAPKQRDMFGNEIKAPIGNMGMLDPFTKTSMNTDPVVQEFVRLVEADKMVANLDEDTKLVIRMPDRTIIKKLQGVPDQKYELNANEYERLVLFTAGTAPELAGKMPSKYEVFKKVMESEGYKKAPDWVKKAYIHSIQHAYNSAAQDYFFQVSGRAEDYANKVKSILIQRGLDNL